MVFKTSLNLRKGVNLMKNFGHWMFDRPYKRFDVTTRFEVFIGISLLVLTFTFGIN